jgi:hypothetical protein
LIPGIVTSEMSDTDPSAVYAKDEAEQAGAMSLYLVSPHADCSKGSLVSVNWDLQEMSAQRDSIETRLLKVGGKSLLGTSETNRCYA